MLLLYNNKEVLREGSRGSTGQKDTWSDPLQGTFSQIKRGILSVTVNRRTVHWQPQP
jgi:hypothetical protein